MQMESRSGMAIAQKVAKLRREIFVWLHGLRRLPTTHRALIPGAAAGYAVIFGFLIYGLAVYARLESWREPPVPAAAAQTLVSAPHAAAAACAEFAGMGQAPCNAKPKVEVAHAELKPRFAALEPLDIQPPAAEQAKPAPHPPAQILIATAEFPERGEEEGGEEDEPLNQDGPFTLSIAYRE